MAVNKWIAGSQTAASPWAALGTGLNSLANSAAATSATFDNTANLDLYADFELVFTHGTAPTADTTHDLYLVRSIDTTNFEDASASRPPAMGAIGSFVCDNVTTAQRKILPGVLLPSGKFQVILVNKSGQAMAASGNTLKAITYNQQVV